MSRNLHSVLHQFCVYASCLYLLAGACVARGSERPWPAEDAFEGVDFSEYEQPATENGMNLRSGHSVSSLLPPDAFDAIAYRYSLKIYNLPPGGSQSLYPDEESVKQINREYYQEQLEVLYGNLKDQQEHLGEKPQSADGDEENPALNEYLDKQRRINLLQDYIQAVRLGMLKGEATSWVNRPDAVVPGEEKEILSSLLASSNYSWDGDPSSLQKLKTFQAHPPWRARVTGVENSKLVGNVLTLMDESALQPKKVKILKGESYQGLRFLGVSTAISSHPAWILMGDQLMTVSAGMDLSVIPVIPPATVAKVVEAHEQVTELLGRINQPTAGDLSPAVIVQLVDVDDDTLSVLSNLSNAKSAKKIADLYSVHSGSHETPNAQQMREETEIKKSKSELVALLSDPEILNSSDPRVREARKIAILENYKKLHENGIDQGGKKLTDEEKNQQSILPTPSWGQNKRNSVRSDLRTQLQNMGLPSVFHSYVDQHRELRKEIGINYNLRSRVPDLLEELTGIPGMTEGATHPGCRVEVPNAEGLMQEVQAHDGHQCKEEGKAGACFKGRCLVCNGSNPHATLSLTVGPCENSVLSCRAMKHTSCEHPTVCGPSPTEFIEDGTACMIAEPFLIGACAQGECQTSDELSRGYFLNSAQDRYKSIRAIEKADTTMQRFQNLKQRVLPNSAPAKTK